jgi:hypothetical protein
VDQERKTFDFFRTLKPFKVSDFPLHKMRASPSKISLMIASRDTRSLDASLLVKQVPLGRSRHSEQRERKSLKGSLKPHHD